MIDIRIFILIMSKKFQTFINVYHYWNYKMF